MTLVTLSGVTDAATIPKISLWRYSAVNRKTLFAALACALLVFSMLGCGTTNDLKSIQLSTSNTAESAPGTLDLQGEGGTIQVYAWGNYSNGSSKLLGGSGIAYQVAVSPGVQVDQYGDTLPTPPQTVLLSSTGLLTAVTPFVCTWLNTAQPPLTAPSWSLSGSYSVTATYGKFTSPPAYLAIASQSGQAGSTNPTGECGPPPTS
jgi:hypothetical protein